MCQGHSKHFWVDQLISCSEPYEMGAIITYHFLHLQMKKLRHTDAS